MRSLRTFPARLSFAACAALAAAPAFAQAPKEFGQESEKRPGFDSKSEVREAGTEAPGGAVVNRGAGAVDRAATTVYYRYKGVDLPLKRFVEYEGNQPFITIIDGQDVLWVARRADLNRVLDKVLYNQLDTMTGAADELFERQRWPSAYRAYKDVLDVLTADANDLSAGDLPHYPAVRSYLLLRMGQARSWEAHQRWQESERLFRQSDEDRATAAKFRRDGIDGAVDMAEVYEQFAREKAASALAAANDGAKLLGEARALLQEAVEKNDRLWQAHNELGILAMERAARATAEGRFDEAEEEIRRALERFRKARPSAREIVDANLIAVHSSLADIEHSRGRFGEALDHVREAMEIAGDPAREDPRAPPRPDDAVSYQVAFTDFHPVRGERIVVTAELQSALARKYLSIERDRRVAGERPVVEESEILARWRRQGEKLLARKRWRGAVGFYTGLHDAYGLGEDDAAAPAEFREHVRASLEKAFGARAEALIEDGREDEAIRVYQLALNYIPNSRVLNQAFVLRATREADRALNASRWEDALAELEKVGRIYDEYAGTDAAKKRTRDDLSLKFGTAYVGLTKAALARGDLSKAGEWADKAIHLTPARPEWKDNKAAVLIALAKDAERVGNKESAFAMYEEARKVAAVGPTKLRAHFSRDAVRAQLLIPKAKRQVVAFTRSYGLLAAVGVLGLVVGIPATRGAMGAAARRRRAKSALAAAQRAYDAKSWNEAIDLFNDYLLTNVGVAEPTAYEYLARAYRKIGDYENALRFFERASSRMPGRKYNLERAEIYLMRRNLALALKALKTSPNVADDAARLVHFLNYLREKDGESVFVTEALAQVQVTAGDFEAGRQLYLRLLDLEPRSPKTLRMLAEIARKAGNARERRLYLEQLVNVDASDAGSLRELGNLLASEGELQLAIDYLRRAHEVAPGEGLAARIAELQAEYLVREAEAEIQRLQREADTPNRRFRIGELHWRLGRSKDAKPYFEEAAQVKEFQARALRYLGLIAVAEKDWQDAISLLRGYLAKRTNLAPDAPEKEARYHLAEAYEKTGQSEHAAAQYEAIFEADPNYKDVASKVKSRMAKSMRKGPQDCPFCRRRVPGDAEFCPHCNYHLASAAPEKFGAEMTPTVVSGDDPDDEKR